MNLKRVELMTDLIVAGMINRAEAKLLAGIEEHSINTNDLETMFKTARELAEQYVEVAEEIEVLEP